MILKEAARFAPTGLSIIKALPEPKLSKIIKGFWCWDSSNLQDWLRFSSEIQERLLKGLIKRGRFLFLSQEGQKEAW